MTPSEIEKVIIKRAKAENPRLAEGKGKWRVTLILIYFDEDSVTAHVAYDENNCTAYMKVVVGKKEQL